MILFHKRVKGQPMQSHRCDFRCVMNSANMTVDWLIISILKLILFFWHRLLHFPPRACGENDAVTIYSEPLKNDLSCRFSLHTMCVYITVKKNGAAITKPWVRQWWNYFLTRKMVEGCIPSNPPSLLWLTSEGHLVQKLIQRSDHCCDKTKVLFFSWYGLNCC